MWWGPEPPRHGGVGGVEDVWRSSRTIPAEVDVGRGVQADARMAVFVVVVLEEAAAEGSGAGDGGEALGKTR